jgi:putative Ca2+/H+ antiporter (TMEM165/GDT1 family)
LVVLDLSILRWRLELGISLHVGNGIGIHTIGKKAGHSHLLCYFLVNRLSRSHGFYYIFSAYYVAELLASFIASATTDISPWIPCGLAMGALFLCLALLWFMPDTHGSNSLHSGHSREVQYQAAENLDMDHVTESPYKHLSIDGIRSALSNTNILLTIPVFLVGIFRSTTLNVLIQYASVRFGLKISTGAAFYTETAVVNIFLFLFLIPRFTAYIRLKYCVQPQVIDLFLVRMSVCVLCLGSLLIGLSPSRNILPFGERQCLEQIHLTH